jgi:pilus assembly protein CpaF
MEIKDQIIAIWSPAGNNTAAISLQLAKEIAQVKFVALVEIPCRGVPMLAVEGNLLDRNKNTDLAILEYEKRKASPLEFFHQTNNSLAILPANAYALPDHPVTHKVEQQETLHDFPIYLINQVRKKGYNVIIYDLQGSLVEPMTFFSLQHADKIFIHVNSPAEVSWALVNKQRLIETYNLKEERFLVLTDLETLEEIEKVLKSPTFSTKQVGPILKYLTN